MQHDILNIHARSVFDVQRRQGVIALKCNRFQILLIENREVGQRSRKLNPLEMSTVRQADACKLGALGKDCFKTMTSRHVDSGKLLI